MIRARLVAAFLVTLVCASTASAQSGQGSLRGYVKDEQGGALPGVTVTATSPQLIQPSTAITDAEGAYRLINLPPGTYTVAVELTGFATYKRTDILLRAGATFEVDVTMKIGTLQETVTVSGESPMIEVSKPGNVLNIDGEFQKNLPIAARRNWTDFLEMTPGVHSRPFDDGSGRMVYFGHATEHFAHVVQLEGMQAGNYNDFQPTYVQMGSDMIADTQVKTGGPDASTPMGTGLAINVVTKSGGNTFKGSAGFAYQPFGWNADNTGARTAFPLVSELRATSGCPNAECVSTGGSPVQSYIRQFDAGLGGPVVRDHMWFFGSLRVSRVETAIGRIDKQVNDILGYFPSTKLFTNQAKGYQPYLKVTTRHGNHELVGLFQRDRLDGQPNWEWYFDPFDAYSNGGNLFDVKLSSVWGKSLTTSVSVGYNNKSGANANTYKAFGFTGSGPRVEVYEGTRIASGFITGTGLILEGGSLDYETYAPASLWLIRGDLTWYRQGWLGSHEFGTGVFLEPRNTYDQIRHYLNNGFDLERRVPVDPKDPSKGLRPFYREYADPLDITTRRARDSDYAGYIQDSWKPSERLTANIGLRADYVKRVDNVFNITRESSWTIQPRVGATFLLTGDAKNVLRASWVRLGEQVMGRDAVTTFGADNTVSFRREYDNNLNGIWGEPGEVQLVPASTTTIAGEQIDKNLHQPYLIEFIAGYRKQFPAQFGLDAAFINRTYNDMWATVDINGFWPSAPGLPFGGYGRIDPNRGQIQRQTNNSWSRLNYRAVEITVTKNMSHGFQLMAGFNRQWHKMTGTWNPTDRAGFIQPDAFANDKNLYMPRGNNEQNSLPDTGNALSYGPTWMKYRMNFGGVWRAPLGVNVASNLTVQAGPWSGALLRQLPSGDPDILKYGPASFRLPNGSSQANPLATANRYVYSTRGEGQIQAPAIINLGLKVGKVVKLPGGHEAELAANVFNVFNSGSFTQYSYNSAYQTWSPNFLQMRNRQPARALQATLVYRF